MSMLKLFGLILLTAFVCLFVIPMLAFFSYVLGVRLLEYLGLY